MAAAYPFLLGPRGTRRGPVLYDYQTGKALRRASRAEADESRNAGPTGVIDVDGVNCYVID